MNVSPLLSRAFASDKPGFFIPGLAAVLCVVFAFVWFGATGGATENLGAYNEAITFVGAQATDKNLFSANGEEIVAKVEESLARGTAALEKASSAEMIEAPQYKIDQLKAVLTAGDELIEEKTKLGLTQDLGLIGSMRANAMQTEMALLERQQWRAITELLYMRRYERDYLDTFDDASVKEHHKYGELLEQEIAQAYLKRSDKEFLTEKAKAYRKDFAALTETIRNIQTLESAYKEKSAVAQKVLSEFGNAAPAESTGIAKAVILGILGLLGLAGAAAGGASFMRARYRPFEKLASYMESLAAGKTQEDVPFRNDTGDVGKIASSVAMLLDAVEQQQAANQKMEVVNENQTEFEQEAAAYIDKVVAEADEISSCGQDIMRKASEVMKGSLFVSEEIAETNSLVLRLAERVDAVDGSLRYIDEGKGKEAAEGMKYQMAEIRAGINKAISKILHINAAILEVKGITKEMAISAEGQGPAARGVVRGIRYVSSIAQERMNGRRRA